MSSYRNKIEHFDALDSVMIPTTIYLVSDISKPGMYLAFAYEDVCIEYCQEHCCCYTEITLFK